MRSLKLDQFEFDYPDSEESLEIDISRKSRFPHPDVVSFVGSAVSVTAAACLAEPVPFFAVDERHQVSEYLKRFGGVDVPVHSDWPTYKISAESWDEVHLIICAPELFVRYCWSTSA